MINQSLLAGWAKVAVVWSFDKFLLRLHVLTCMTRKADAMQGIALITDLESFFGLVIAAAYRLLAKGAAFSYVGKIILFAIRLALMGVETTICKRLLAMGTAKAIWVP